MIGRLEGVLADKAPDALVIDVGGVGYELRVPLSTFLELPDAGKTVRLHVYTHVREDTLQLYGFLSGEERLGFKLLLGISGVGPRMALAILSRIPQGRMGSADEIADVVAFLATRGSYVNGTVIHVNGGMYGG